MTLPAAITGHQIIWIRRPMTRYSVPVRFVRGGDALVCFGDGPLDVVRNGERVFVDVGSPSHLEAEFPAVVRDVPADEVDDDTLLELLSHVSLGSTLDEVKCHLRRQRHRRLVRIQPA